MKNKNQSNYVTTFGFAILGVLVLALFAAFVQDDGITGAATAYRAAVAVLTPAQAEAAALKERELAIANKERAVALERQEAEFDQQRAVGMVRNELGSTASYKSQARDLAVKGTQGQKFLGSALEVQKAASPGVLGRSYEAIKGAVTGKQTPPPSAGITPAQFAALKQEFALLKKTVDGRQLPAWVSSCKGIEAIVDPNTGQSIGKYFLVGCRTPQTGGGYPVKDEREYMQAVDRPVMYDSGQYS